jgi:uncharacterized protein (DUF2249 family)
MTDNELDVRQLRKPDKHPTIFASYAKLGVGESFVLVNNHDPKHLQSEFEVDHPGSYGWEYLEKGPIWRIRISKLTATPLPRVLVNTADVAAAEPDVTGAAWKLELHDRDLDSNVIALPPHGGIGEHAGADVDVMIHVLSGGGQLITEQGEIELRPGTLLWLPKLSRRQFSAGPDGLRYLTVHRHREIGGLMPTMRQAV